MTPGWLESDFFIAPTHMNCDQLVDGRVIATIRRFGRRDRRCEGSGAALTQKALNPPF